MQRSIGVCNYRISFIYLFNHTSNPFIKHCTTSDFPYLSHIQIPQGLNPHRRETAVSLPPSPSAGKMKPPSMAVYGYERLKPATGRERNILVAFSGMSNLQIAEQRHTSKARISQKGTPYLRKRCWYPMLQHPPGLCHSRSRMEV